MNVLEAPSKIVQNMTLPPRGELWASRHCVYKGRPPEPKEKDKFEIFSTFERRKRHGFSIVKLQEEKEKVKTISPFSRREREMLNPVPLF